MTSYLFPSDVCLSVCLFSLQIYYSGQTYYSLETSKEIDNPDQRIAEDVRAFTQVSLEFLITILTSCIDLVSFSSILYS